MNTKKQGFDAFTTTGVSEHIKEREQNNVARLANRYELIKQAAEKINQKNKG